MVALTNTDVSELLKDLEATYQPGGVCAATPRKMQILLDRLQEYTDEVQWARNQYKILGAAAMAGGPAGALAGDLLGGGDVDVAQWRSDMANWQYRLAEYQRIVESIPEEKTDSVEGCEELYALVTAPLLDGIHYTVAPGIVLNAEEKARIRSGQGHPNTDVTGEHGGGHSNAKPPDVVTPFSLGNQIVIYQDFQKENLERFIEEIVQRAKDAVNPSKWPWWLKGAAIAGAGATVGLVALYAYQFLPKAPKRNPRRRKSANPKARFDPDELAAGTLEEMEHTTDRKVARRIAKDHLGEDPRYYTKLAKAGLMGPRKNPKRPTEITSTLSSSAEAFWKKHGDKMQSEGHFLTFGKGAKKTMGTVRELCDAGLVSVHRRGDEYVVTGKDKQVKTLSGVIG